MSINASEKQHAQPLLPPNAPRACVSATTAEGVVTRETTVPVILIGGRRDCDLPLPHPEISKVHCALVNTGQALLACDLLSRTGTFVNERQVRTAVLRPGDILRVGPVKLAIKFSGQNTTDPYDDPSGDADPLRLAPPLILERNGRRRELRHVAVIGRRNTADVILDTPDVSLAHALVFPVDGRPAICDLGSRSGTWLNGERVDLSWLGEGDELVIADEKLRVRWEPPQATPSADRRAAAQSNASAGAEAVPYPSPVPGAAPGATAELMARSGLVPAGLADLTDLEQTLAAVQSHISAARAEIEDRRRELDEREAELARQGRELNARQQEVERAQAGLEPREAAVQAGEETVRQKLTAVADREQAVENGRTKLASETLALEARRAELETRGAQLDEQRSRLETEKAALAADLARLRDAQSALEQQQQALNQASEGWRQREEELRGRAAQLEESAAALEARTAELAAREANLLPRERELSEQEAALRQRESYEAQVFQKISDFKFALRQAGELLSTATPVGAAANLPESAPASSTAESARPAGDPAAVLDELPAPMVDRPLFAAGAAPPPDWPPEMRERFLVLRRMSKKSDEELFAQVRGEWNKTLPPRTVSRPPPAKKRRFPWSN